MPFGLLPRGADRKAIVISRPHRRREDRALHPAGQNDAEIVTGGDDKHDFRVSVRRLTDAGANRVALTTIVSPHNFFGRAYLFVILPFHRLGVRTLLANAVAAGRL
jgi:hypothetical protein